MPLHDATMPLVAGMPAYPGDPPFRLEPVSRRRRGDPFDSSLVTLCTHTGTHVDAGSHYLDSGGGVDAIPLELLIGPAMILDLRGRCVIDRAALDGTNFDGFARVLLKTDNSPKLRNPEFDESFVHLTPDAAQYLVERGVRLVGIDYLSIEGSSDPEAPVHKTLLAAGVVIVEGVCLDEIPTGPCEVYCLPLRLVDADGAPARVLIRTQ